MEKKLSAIPYGQAKVRMLSGFFHNELISYQTTVAAIRGGWLYIYGLYSATTRRHIGAYVKEYANISYQTAKELYEKKMKYNIYTGEVAPI
jgi:hypothetical protein